MTRKHIIYIVDDDQEDWELLNEVFDKANCAEKVDHFFTVKELLMQLSNPSAPLPHLVILDHQVPDISGGEAVQLLRKNKRYNQVALAVYSSSIPPFKQQELLSQGVDLCIPKGCTMQEMTLHVKMFCELAAKRREVEN